MNAEMEADTVEIELPTPQEKKIGRKIKHRRARRKIKAARPRADKKPLSVPEEFSGMTERDCCTDCRSDRCVISGRPWCGHPYKGQQPGVMSDPQVMERFNNAKKALRHRKIDLRG